MEFKNMKMIAIICSLTLSMSSLQAGSCSSDNDGDDKAMQRRQMMSSKRAQKAHKEDMKEQKTSGDWGVKMPAAHGCSSNEGFVMSMEYLIMRSYQPNMAYAFEKKNILESTRARVGSISVKGKMVRPTRTWRPGFKVNLGWNTPYDLWDIQSEWMYYYNKSVTNKSTDPMILSSFANTDEGFVPYWAIPVVNSGAGDLPAGSLPVVTYTELQGVWQMNYNMINLELGRSLYLTKSFALRPHFGLQNGWIHQKVQVAYARSLNVSPTNGGNTRPLDQLATLHNNFWGIGLRTGFNAEWQLGAGFSLVGKLAASLLSGRTNARRIQDSAENATITGPGGDAYYRLHNITDRINELAPGLDTGLGLNWGTCMSSDTMYFGLSLNWESIYWWSQFRFLQPEAIRNEAGTLSQFDYRGGLRERYPFDDNALNIEGFTVKARFDF